MVVLLSCSGILKGDVGVVNRYVAKLCSGSFVGGFVGSWFARGTIGVCCVTCCMGCGTGTCLFAQENAVLAALSMSPQRKVVRMGWCFLEDFI